MKNFEKAYFKIAFNQEVVFLGKREVSNMGYPDPKNWDVSGSMTVVNGNESAHSIHISYKMRGSLGTWEVYFTYLDEDPHCVVKLNRTKQQIDNENGPSNRYGIQEWMESILHDIEFRKDLPR